MSDNPTIHVWVTKYALTQGVFEVDVEHCVDISDKMVIDRTKTFAHYHKPHWHLTREEAVAQADKMRQRKIASLQRSISKLKQLKFP